MNPSALADGTLLIQEPLIRLRHLLPTGEGKTNLRYAREDKTTSAAHGGMRKSPHAPHRPRHRHRRPRAR